MRSFSTASLLMAGASCQTFQIGLPDILLLRPRAYRNSLTGKPRVGFVSEEVHAALPNLVDGDGYVNYPVIAAGLLEAIHDLHDKATNATTYTRARDLWCPSPLTDACNSTAFVGPFATKGRQTLLQSIDQVYDIPYGLETVMKLAPSTWTWKESGKAGTGLIAQEVLHLVPEVVTVRKNMKLALEYDSISAVLVNAVHQLNERFMAKKGLVAPAGWKARASRCVNIGGDNCGTGYLPGAADDNDWFTSGNGPSDLSLKNNIQMLSVIIQDILKIERSFTEGKVRYANVPAQLGKDSDELMLPEIIVLVIKGLQALASAA